jgi:hypothetical protein
MIKIMLTDMFRDISTGLSRVNREVELIVSQLKETLKYMLRPFRTRGVVIQTRCIFRT